ncbi:MAG TPA: phage portal protein [Candidatus Aquilonibacter sp.]|nr:phage portal protein [Candidatus Aquilonibacter sp.]
MANLTLLNLESPSRPQKRTVPASELAIRGFNAAKITRQTMDWAMSPLSRDQKVFQALRPLRFRSRQLADNDATMQRFLDLCVTNVIGQHGVRMQPKVKLQRGGSLNADLNKQIADEWKAWSAKGNCTMDGKYTFHELEELVMRTTPMDGESLFLKNVADNPWGFSLQFLDADQLDPTYFVKWDGIREVRMGVEIDKFQRPMAYWLYSGHPSEIGNGPANRYRIPAESVLHLYRPDSARQTRGIPWATPVMGLMFQLRGTYEAATVATRLAASVMGFIRKPAPEGELPLTEVDEHDGRSGELWRDGRRTDGDDIDAEPGSFHTLYDGEDITTFKSEFPTAALQPFIKEVKRDIATGLDVAYVSLYDDLSDINFSSIRAGLLMERDAWRRRQRWVIENFHRPVFRSWLKSAVLSGRVQIGTADIDAVCNQIKWHPRGWDWVDPQKDANATVLRLGNGLSTYSSELGSQGLDFEEVMDERAREQKYVEDLQERFGLRNPVMLGTDLAGDQAGKGVAAGDEDAAADVDEAKDGNSTGKQAQQKKAAKKKG